MALSKYRGKLTSELKAYKTSNSCYWEYSHYRGWRVRVTTKPHSRISLKPVTETASPVSVLNALSIFLGLIWRVLGETIFPFSVTPLQSQREVPKVASLLDKKPQSPLSRLNPLTFLVLSTFLSKILKTSAQNFCSKLPWSSELDACWFSFKRIESFFLFWGQGISVDALWGAAHFHKECFNCKACRCYRQQSRVRPTERKCKIEVILHLPSQKGSR